MNRKPLADRVRDLIASSGARSERAFAQTAGVSLGALRGVLAGSSPTMENLVAIARAGGVSVDWLATGEAHNGPAHDQEVDSFPAVPRYDVALSAGHGSFIERAEQLDSIPFTADFFTRRLGRGPKGLAIVDARGDSMEPTISDRDLVMIDTTDTQLTPAIWAFTLDDAVLVKRLSPTAGGLEIVSDNPLYGRQQLDSAQAAQVNLIGRVVWVGRVL